MAAQPAPQTAWKPLGPLAAALVAAAARRLEGQKG